MIDENGAELRQFIESWESLDEEKRDIANDQKEIMAEARARGYDTRMIREVIRLRKMHADERAERDAVLQMYLDAVEGRHDASN